MSLLESLRQRAGKTPPRILFTDGEEDRALTAAAVVAREGTARPSVLGSPERVTALARRLDVRLDGVEVIDPCTAPQIAHLGEALAERRGIGPRVASKLLERPVYLGLSLLRDGAADAVVAGVSTATRDVLLACEMILGRRDGSGLASSVFALDVPGFNGSPRRALLFADCAINPNPSAEELADIAIQAADAGRALLAEEPRVALLSFSTHGSASHPDVDKVIRATALVRARRPDLVVDGEMQADAALDAGAAGHKLDDPGPVAGRANVLVFPDLDAANIGYKLVRALGHANAYGVFLQGYRAPVVKLSRGSTVDEIVGTCALLAALAAS